jgi:hypothetical protein
VWEEFAAGSRLASWAAASGARQTGTILDIFCPVFRLIRISCALLMATHVFPAFLALSEANEFCRAATAGSRTVARPEEAGTNLGLGASLRREKSPSQNMPGMAYFFLGTLGSMSSVLLVELGEEKSDWVLEFEELKSS